MADSPTSGKRGRPRADARRNQFIVEMMVWLIRDVGLPRESVRNKRGEETRAGAGTVGSFLLSDQDPALAPTSWYRKTDTEWIEVSPDATTVRTWWRRSFGPRALALGIDRPIRLSPDAILKVYDGWKNARFAGAIPGDAGFLRPWERPQQWICPACGHNNQFTPDRGDEPPHADTPCRKCGGGLGALFETDSPA